MNQQSVSQVQDVLTIGFGILVTMLIPTIAGIFWSIYSKNTKALEQNTHAIVKLETKIDMIFPHLSEIPKMKSDLNHLHDKVREHGQQFKDIQA